MFGRRTKFFFPCIAGQVRDMVGQQRDIEWLQVAFKRKRDLNWDARSSSLMQLIIALTSNAVKAIRRTKLPPSVWKCKCSRYTLSSLYSSLHTHSILFRCSTSVHSGVTRRYISVISSPNLLVKLAYPSSSLRVAAMTERPPSRIVILTRIQILS